MNIFTNKSIWKKIAIALVFVILFEALLTNPVMGADVIEGGGKLLKPIFSLFVTIGDGVMNLLHSSIMNIDGTLIKVDTESPGWQFFKDLISVIVSAACVIGVILLTGGSFGAFLGVATILSVVSNYMLGTNVLIDLAKERTVEQFCHALESI